jgi:hypothetical protein
MLMLIISTFVGSLTAVYMCIQYEQYAKELEVAEDAGRSVVMIGAQNARDSVVISRSSCELLQRDPAVRASGLLVEVPRSAVLKVGNSVATVRASASLVPELRTSQAVIGSQVGASLGESSRLFAVGYGVLDTRVGLNDESKLGLGSSLVLPLNASDVGGPVCVVVYDSRAKVDEELSASVSQLVASNAIMGVSAYRSASDPAERFATRIERFAPYLGGVCLGLASVVRYVLKASDLAAYRLSGTSRFDLARIVWSEQLLTSGVATAAYMGAALVLGPGGRALASLCLYGLFFGMVWLSVASICLTSLVRRSAVGLAKAGS